MHIIKYPFRALLSLCFVLSTITAAPPAERNWELTFEDNFDQPTIDTSVWHVREYMLWKDGHYLHPDNVYTSGGNLVLRTAVINGQYTSGMARTRELSNLLFSQTFGYFEAKMKFSTEVGQWATFWMMPKNIHGADNSGRDGAEFDIAEGYTRDGTMNHAIHYDGYNFASTHQAADAKSYVGDIENEWHVYGFEWTPTRYTWYVDGKKTWEITDSTLISQVEQYLKFSTEIADWVGDISQANLPAYSYVDWVRAYRDIGASSGTEAADPTLGSELIMNGSFESDLNNWTVTGGTSQVFTSAAVGSKAVKLSNRSSQGDQLQQNILSSLSNETSGNYQIEAWFKFPSGNSGKGHAEVALSIKKANGQWVQKAATREVRTNGWTKLSSVIYMDEDPSTFQQANVIVRALNDSVSGTNQDFLVDGVSIKKYTVEGQGSGSDPIVVIEGESMTLDTRLEVLSMGSASSGEVVGVISGQSIGLASFTYSGASEEKTMRVDLVDRSGSSYVKLYRNSTVLATWTLSADDNAIHTYEHTANFTDGDTIKVKLWGNERLDAVSYGEDSGGATPPPTTSNLVEAEDSTLVRATVVNDANASNGQIVEVESGETVGIVDGITYTGSGGVTTIRLGAVDGAGDSFVKLYINGTLVNTYDLNGAGNDSAVDLYHTATLTTGDVIKVKLFGAEKLDVIEF